jgi:hypothetical protein
MVNFIPPETHLFFAKIFWGWERPRFSPKEFEAWVFSFLRRDLNKRLILEIILEMFHVKHFRRRARRGLGFLAK